MCLPTGDHFLAKEYSHMSPKQQVTNSFKRRKENGFKQEILALQSFAKKVLREETFKFDAIVTEPPSTPSRNGIYETYKSMHFLVQICQNGKEFDFFETLLGSKAPQLPWGTLTSLIGRLLASRRLVSLLSHICTNSFTKLTLCLSNLSVKSRKISPVFTTFRVSNCLRIDTQNFFQHFNSTSSMCPVFPWMWWLSVLTSHGKHNLWIEWLATKLFINRKMVILWLVGFLIFILGLPALCWIFTWMFFNPGRYSGQRFSIPSAERNKVCFDTGLKSSVALA